MVVLADNYNPVLRTNKELETDFFCCMAMLRLIDYGSRDRNLADRRPVLLNVRGKIATEIYKRRRAETNKIFTLENPRRHGNRY